MAQAQTDEILRAPARIFDYQRLVDGLVFILVASSAISLVEPSPFDLLAPLALLLWALGGFTIHRAILPFALLLVAYCLMGFLALTPYWRDVDSITYQALSTYLMMMGVFFALFLAQSSERRAEVILSALTFGALIAAVCGLLGYFNVAGPGETFTLYDRAKGTFKDPNVLGPYLTPGVLNLLQKLMLGRARSVLISVAALAIILAGEFVTFSRGAWGVTLFSIALMTGCTYAQADNARLKRRIMTTAIIAAIVGALVVLILLAQDSTREFFLQRANATQDYDEGETGRFGN